MKPSLTIVSLAILAIGLYAGWNELHSVLVIGFLAFVTLLFTAHLDQIAEFKASGSGIEARTRAVVTQAKNTVTEMQTLARIFAKTTLSSVKRTGRIGGYEDDEEERIKTSVLSVLKNIGISESEYDNILHDWYCLTEFDYAMAILGGHTIPQGFDDQAIQVEWKALRDFKHIPTPTQLKEFLAKWDLLDEAHLEYIKDYDYYITNREHRRLKVWRERKSWGVLKKL